MTEEDYIKLQIGALEARIEAVQKYFDVIFEAQERLSRLTDGDHQTIALIGIQRDTHKAELAHWKDQL